MDRESNRMFQKGTLGKWRNRKLKKEDLDLKDRLSSKQSEGRKAASKRGHSRHKGRRKKR